MRQHARTHVCASWPNRVCVRDTCVARPSCGGRMRAPPRVYTRKKTCMRDPSDSRVLTRNSNAKRRDRIACHRCVPRDHRDSRSRATGRGKRGGSRDLIAGSRFHGERVLFTDATSGSRFNMIGSRRRVKICTPFFFFPLRFVDVDGKLMAESRYTVVLSRRIVLESGSKDLRTGNGVPPSSF